MANRRFEMFELRQIVVRMRLGDTDRQIAKAGLCGRKKAAAIRELATGRGWLDPATVLPEDGILIAALRPGAKRKSSESSLLLHAEDIGRWANEKLSGVVDQLPSGRWPKGR